MTTTLGFTGTRDGVNEVQFDRMWRLMKYLNEYTGYDMRITHGDCFGADEIFHQMGVLLETPMVIRPCIIDKWRANCGTEKYKGTIDNTVLVEKIHEPDDPGCRNRMIVVSSLISLATPKQDKEVLRSGTWMTIRIARKRKCPMLIIYPDGMVVAEQWKYLDKPFQQFLLTCETEGEIPLLWSAKYSGG